MLPGTMTEPILRAVGLTKSYGPFQALHGVGFALMPGDIVGFLGPNGAGKSTTMKILTGFVAPTGGTATINGHDLATDPLACRASIGYLPEELPLYLDMTVESYLDHVARLKGVHPGERRREVWEAIESAWLQENAKRHIRKLSKGNRQRVGVAQALIGKPPILILDEPTSGLDPSQVANFRDLIRRLAEKHTILLSTHILAEVEAVCRRVVVVHRGRTVVEEGIDDLRRRATTTTRLRVSVRDPSTVEALAAALETMGWASRLQRDPGAPTIHLEAPVDRRAELVALVEGHGGLRELVEERLTLEEVFRDLTGQGQPVAALAVAGTSRP